MTRVAMSDVLTLARATADDAGDVVAVRAAAAEALTTRFGRGHWSTAPTERSVLASIRDAHVWLARQGDVAAGTFQLSTRKPWAIERSFFTPADSVLYLTNMAVHPTLQRSGVGRRCVEEALRIAQAWPAHAIRLDAYDAPAGAGGFYERCGFRGMGGTSYRGVPLLYYEFLL